jgi:small subunit ribosomal protein S8
MVQNSFANCIVLLRNGLKNKNHFVIIQKSIILYSFLNFLIQQGFILGFMDYNEKYIKVFLKYNPYGIGVLHDIKLLSTKSRRLYVKYEFLKYFRSNVGIFILSTTNGYLTHQQAILQKIGGELVCYVV